MTNGTYTPFMQSSAQFLQNLQGSVSKSKQASPSLTQKFSGVANNVKKSAATITTPFGGSTKYESFHPGIDIAAPMGTKIPAVRGGTVLGVGRGTKQGTPGFGNYVLMQDEQGNTYRYSHLYNDYVQVGQKIQQGQPIGRMGNTGSTYSTSGGSGTHLDLRIKDAWGKYVNPLSYLKRQ